MPIIRLPVCPARFVVAVLALLIGRTAPLFAQAPVASPPIVEILQKSRIVTGVPSLPVTFYLCGDAEGFDVRTLTIQLNNVDVSASFSEATPDVPIWANQKCVSLKK